MHRAIQFVSIFSTTDSVRRSINCGCFVLTDFSISLSRRLRRTSVAYSILPINTTIRSDATFTLQISLLQIIGSNSSKYIFTAILIQTLNVTNKFLRKFINLFNLLLNIKWKWDYLTGGMYHAILSDNIGSCFNSYSYLQIRKKAFINGSYSHDYRLQCFCAW